MRVHLLQTCHSAGEKKEAQVHGRHEALMLLLLLRFL
jgi:hypothetical protein